MEPPRRALALAMVYASQPDKRGQRFRDHLRLTSLETECNCEVYSVDLHDESEAVPGRHVAANVDAKRFQKSVGQKWAGLTFDFACLDYFGMPSAYVEDVMGSGVFLRQNVPFLFSYFGLSQLWLPNTISVLRLVKAAEPTLQANGLCFILVTNPDENPLYRATEKVSDQLKLEEEMKENDTQLPRLDLDAPFICIQRK